MRLCLPVVGLCGLVLSAVALPARSDSPPALPTPYVSTRLVLNDFPEVHNPGPDVSRIQTGLREPLIDIGATGSSTGSVFASMGIVQMSSRSWFIGTSGLQASFGDAVTIVPADSSLIGKPGRFTASLDIALSRGGATAPTPAGEAAFVWAEYGVGAKINDQIFGGGLHWMALTDGETTITGTGPGTLAMIVDFTFGRPFGLNVKVSADTHAEAGAAFDSSAFVDVLSVRWGGFAALFDGQGSSVSEYSVVSESGVDWSVVAVPEPGTFGWLFASMVIILRRKR